ncbi:MAG: PD-(D/E)XK nuclease family protein [Thermoproteota archaeon]
MSKKESLEDHFLKLLKKDEKFRLAVASYLGYDKIFNKLDMHDKKFDSILKEIKASREDQKKLWKEVRSLREGQNNLWKEVRALRVNQNKLWEEVKALREGQNKLWENQNKLWEEVKALREGQNKLWENQNKLWEEVRSLREGQNELWKNQTKLWEEVRSLREDMNKGFGLIERHISALGARWGLMSEEAFREGLKGLLGKELGLKVERWLQHDDEGVVYGYPSDVEIDMSIKDGKTILIEVSSHVKASDVAIFKRKIDFYTSKTGEKVDRFMIVTPYIDEDAIRASKEFGFEVYTKV